MQPIVILVALPFGMVGAILGHLVMGLSLTLLSLFGIVALSGIVVNDSITLLDFINRAIRNGTPIMETVEQSGKARFCAIGKKHNRPVTFLQSRLKDGCHQEFRDLRSLALMAYTPPSYF